MDKIKLAIEEKTEEAIESLQYVELYADRDLDSQDYKRIITSRYPNDEFIQIVYMSTENSEFEVIKEAIYRIEEELEDEFDDFNGFDDYEDLYYDIKENTNFDCDNVEKLFRNEILYFVIHLGTEYDSNEVYYSVSARFGDLLDVLAGKKSFVIPRGTPMTVYSQDRSIKREKSRSEVINVDNRKNFEFDWRNITKKPRERVTLLKVR